MSQEPSQSLDLITEVLARVGRKGVKLWVKNGQLHYRAAKGSLDNDEIETLRSYKDQIVSMLERAANSSLAESTVSFSSPDITALSFSQEAHWHRYKLQDQHCFRTIASATRMIGCLNFDLFRDSMAEVVRRHPGLRTRIVVRDGTPMQQVSESADFKFKMQDLRMLPTLTLELEVKRLIEELILTPIRVSEDPLWEAHLLKLRDQEHVLIVVMEHIISDMLSVQILLRDIFSTYTQRSWGHPVTLPAIPMQFTEYAERQRKALDSPGAPRSYWTTRLSGCPRVRFPHDRELLADVQHGWDHVNITITSQRRDSLSTWSRFMKTTLAMAVFTVYAALISRWCEVSDVVIHYVTDGRSSEKVRHTIGYFAKLLPIRVELDCTDTFVTLLKRITMEYYKAYEQADFYHLDAQLPAPDFALNSNFNWITQRNWDPTEGGVLETDLRCSPIVFEPPIPETAEVDVEPFLLLYDSGREVTGGIYFPKKRFSLIRMQRFASNFSKFMEALLEKPDRPICDVIPL